MFAIRKTWLLRIRELLIPGGVLLLITPSLDSWTRRLLRSRWMEYKVEHLYYFSAAVHPAVVGTLRLRRNPHLAQPQGADDRLHLASL